MVPDQQPQPQGNVPQGGFSPIPPPPPTPPQWGSAVEAVFHWNQRNWREQQLEQELRATREELQALQALLEDLPQIFECKFQGRLQPILEEQQRLLQENTTLRRQLLPPQPNTAAAPKPVLLAAVPELGSGKASGLRSALRRVLPWSLRRQQTPSGSTEHPAA